jgi:hypothetical protein
MLSMVNDRGGIDLLAYGSADRSPPWQLLGLAGDVYPGSRRLLV